MIICNIFKKYFINFSPSVEIIGFVILFSTDTHHYDAVVYHGEANLLKISRKLYWHGHFSNFFNFISTI